MATTPDPGDLLGSQAQAASRGVLSSAVTKAAEGALAAAAGAQASSYVGEVVADFRTIRRNAALVSAVAESTAAAQDQAEALLLDGLTKGYRATAEAEAAGLGLAYAFGPEDAALLRDFPIVEHTAAEHAAQLAAGLAFDVQGAVSRVISGGLPADGLPARLDELAAAWSTRVGALVADAWHTGANAARHAMAAVLSA